ncbi:DUF4426 domain-containing protein [Pseudomonas sp. CGJS7]|uniref:DUF4426 domain-containing protein n=1 Tax=Pseudomonas sp. CGJS7 TaxID=3109348 RepID=UPI00300B82E5
MSALARTVAAAALATALLAGCGRESSTPPQHAANAAGPETKRSGDVTMTVSAIQTDKLPAQIVQRYGAPRDARTVLIVLSLRKGDDATSVALSADQVQVTVSDLLGRKQQIAMRPMRDGELLDYVGTATISPPETLRFDVVANTAHGRYPVQFNRDFF